MEQAIFFQTGWFLESLATQAFVIHIIRTKKTPFLQSSPSRYLLISNLACVAFGWILPFTAVGRLFGFVMLPFNILLTLAAIVATYLVVVEIAKRLFYMKFDF
jgi:Mg2+-importing ATPase